MATFITPVFITPNTANSWITVDVSSYIPVGSTGVLLHIVNTYSDVFYSLGFRKNGSTDNRTDTFNGHSWFAIGVDADRKLQLYVGDISDIEIYLVGYFGSEAVFFDNGIDKTPATRNSWQDVDISSNTGADTAIGAIFEVCATSGGVWGFRKKGSTDDRHYSAFNHHAGIIGVNASEVCQAYIGYNVYSYLVGYIKSGATFNDNATDVSLSTTGSWVDLSELPSGAIGGIYEVKGISGRDFGLRKNGSNEDIYEWGPHSWATVECDGSRLIEGKIQSLDYKFYLIGYFEQTIINQTITPPVATTTFTAPIPNICLNMVISSPVATASFTALAPDIVAGMLILSPVAIATFTALAPSIPFLTVYVGNAAQAQFSAPTPSVGIGKTIPVENAGQAQFTALAPSISYGCTIVIPAPAQANFTALVPITVGEVPATVIEVPVANVSFVANIPVITATYDYFPLSSEASRRMLSYLPPYYQTSNIMRRILVAQGIEIDNLRDALDSILQQFFATTVSFAIDTWEYELGLKSTPDLDLDERRRRIIAKLGFYNTTIISQTEEKIRFRWKEMLLGDGLLDVSKFNEFLSYLNQFKGVYITEIDDGTPEGDLVFEFSVTVQPGVASADSGYFTATICRVKNLINMLGFGESEIIEDHSAYAIYIRFLDIEGKPLGIEFVQATLREFIPAHLTIDFVYSFFTWDEWDNLNETWDTFDAFDITWDDLEVRV